MRPIKVNLLNMFFPSFALLLLIVGCNSGNPAIMTQDVPAFTHVETVGTSVQGRPIEIVLLGEGEKTVFLMSTIHGNEQAGTRLLEEMIWHLRGSSILLEHVTVIIMPVANPDGLAANTRYNANKIDLNRDFITSNSKTHKQGESTTPQPECLAIERVIRKYNPDIVVTLHQPLNCIDYDGPGEMLASQMAALCDLPVKKLGARPGSLGSFVGLMMDKPIITVELARTADTLPADMLWKRYGEMLMTAVTYSIQAK